MKFEEFKKEHQGKHFCKLCGAEINITHQHIYVGIPAFCSPAHHKKWDAEQKWQRFLRDRDNYTCQLCWKSGKNVHHIDTNKKDNNLNNLITLCPTCHKSEAHGKNREEVKELLIILNSVHNLQEDY